MYSNELLSLLIPKAYCQPEQLEEKYPKRKLPEGAHVTRFGPSPTGFMHIGGVYTAMLSKNLAKQSGGVYFVRIEDTDKKREVAGMQSHFDKSFEYFDIAPHEDDCNGNWGPYKQSERSNLYLTYVKHLLKIGRAYPCFCSEHSLDQKSEEQRAAKVDTGYHGRWATCRDLREQEVKDRIKEGRSYIIRFRSNGVPGPFDFDDLIRGRTKVKNNINDVVILKSSANDLPLPTYHLAHAVDDHLMRVTLVIRGEEWISSVPLHMQLFDALGFERIPYAHIAPLMKIDGKSRRKLSKRKDPEASVDYYMERGYPTKSLLIYLKGLANSKLASSSIEECLSGSIKLEDCQVSGPLVDLDKLDDISSNFVATLSAEEIRENVLYWAKNHNKDLVPILEQHWDKLSSYIDADRFPNGRVRKDLFRWSDFKNLYGFFFNEWFDTVNAADDKRFRDLPPNVVKEFLSSFVKCYTHNPDNTEWFSNIQDIASRTGFALNNKEYKKDPDSFYGTIKEASGILRIVITGRDKSPSLHEVCMILGKEEVIRRSLSALGYDE